MNTCGRYLRLVLLALAGASIVCAQNTTSGGLAGAVTDPRGAVIPNVVLELRDNGKGTRQSTTTNSTGVYSFQFLPPGSYTLSATRSGFQTSTRRLDINLGPPGSLNITLEIEGAHETVQVTGEATLFHADRGDASTSMNALQVAQVPNPGNDLTYFPQTGPGAIMNTDQGAGSFSILGMPGTSNMLTLNGMSYTDVGSNINMSSATNLLLGMNQVQEATIVTNGYSGQFGVLAGSSVNYVSKSGANDVHGNLLYFWNGSALNANSWINNAFSTPRPFDNANQWAGSVGGPIRKNKLFFFLDTEGLDLLVPQGTQEVILPSPQFQAATLANIDSKFGSTSASDSFYKKIFALYNQAPGASTATAGTLSDPLGCAGGFTGPEGLGTSTPCAVHYVTTLKRPTWETMVAGRVDWNLRSTDQIFVLAEYNHGHQASFTDAISPVFNTNSDQPWWQGQLVATHLFSPSMANQLLITTSQLTAYGGPQSFSATYAALPTHLLWDANGAFTNAGSRRGSKAGGRFVQYQATDDVSASWANHRFGFGGSFLHHINGQLFGTDQGNLLPVTLDAFFQGGVDPNSPDTDTTLLTQTFPSQPARTISYDLVGAYIQDEWHARPGLSFTFALRAEHNSDPACKGRCFGRLNTPFGNANHDPAQPYSQILQTNLEHAYAGLDSVTLAPRFSFAWQPFGTLKNTVLRGGMGVFYDAVPGFLASLMAENPPLFNSYTIQGSALSPNETTNLFQTAASSNAALLHGFATGQSFAELKATVQGFTAPALTSPDHLQQTPRYQKWSLEVQQLFGRTTSVTIGYFGNHGLHELVQNQSANAFGFGALPAGVCTSPPVPPCADARFGEVNQLETAGVSNYNGAVLSFQHRLTGRSRGVVQVNYTYGHAFDEVSNGGLLQFAYGSSLVPENPSRLHDSYGQADYDVRHSLTANYVWDLPLKAVLHGHGFDWLVKGWQISGNVFARTGLPYTVTDNQLSSSLGANNFFGPIYAVPARPLGPHLPCGEGAAIPIAAHPCQTPQVLADGMTPNTDAQFLQSGCETSFSSGNLPGAEGPCAGPQISFIQNRNRFRYPNYVNTDLGILKNTRIPVWEKAELGVGFRFFNLLNHPSFGGPDNSTADLAFGQIFYMASPPTSILGSGLGADTSPRNIQLKAQIRF